jgi:hypothetical protein
VCVLYVVWCICIVLVALLFKSSAVFDRSCFLASSKSLTTKKKDKKYTLLFKKFVAVTVTVPFIPSNLLTINKNPPNLTFLTLHINIKNQEANTYIIYKRNRNKEVHTRGSFGIFLEFLFYGNCDALLVLID